MVYYVIFPLLLQLATQLASWARGLRPRLKMRPNVKRWVRYVRCPPPTHEAARILPLPQWSCTLNPPVNKRQCTVWVNKGHKIVDKFIRSNLRRNQRPRACIEMLLWALLSLSTVWIWRRVLKCSNGKEPLGGCQHLFGIEYGPQTSDKHQTNTKELSIYRDKRKRQTALRQRGRTLLSVCVCVGGCESVWV